MGMLEPISGFTGPPRAGSRSGWRSRPGSTKGASSGSSLWEGNNYSTTGYPQEIEAQYSPFGNAFQCERTLGVAESPDSASMSADDALGLGGRFGNKASMNNEVDVNLKYDLEAVKTAQPLVKEESIKLHDNCYSAPSASSSRRFSNMLSTERTGTGKQECGAEDGLVGQVSTDKDGKSSGNFSKISRKVFSGLGLSKKTETESTSAFDTLDFTPEPLGHVLAIDNEMVEPVPKAEFAAPTGEKSRLAAPLAVSMGGNAVFRSYSGLDDFSLEEPMYFSASEVAPLSRTQGWGNLSRFTPTQRTAPEAKDKSISTELSLEKLVEAQTAEGRFKLSDDLSSVLKDKFTNWIWDLIVDELGEDMLYENLSDILDTARAIVFIEVMYPEIQDQWGLVVQKARGFLNTVIPGRRETKRLEHLLQIQLSGGKRKAIDAIKDNWIRSRLLGRRDLIGIIGRINVVRETDLLPKLLRDVIPPYDSSAVLYAVWNLIASLGKQAGSLSHYPTIEPVARETEGRVTDLKRKIEDPEEWTDGWIEVLELSQAIRLVMKEKGYPGY